MKADFRRELDQCVACWVPGERDAFARRIEAVVAAGGISRAEFVCLIENGKGDVRKWACDLANEVPIPEAAYALRRVLLSDDEPDDIRIEAARALTGVGRPRLAANALIAALRGARSDAVRVEVIDALRYVTQRRAAPILIALFEDEGERPAVREAAAGWLGLIRARRAAAPLLRSLAQPWRTAEERNAVIAVLGSLGDIRAIGPLQSILFDEPAERLDREGAAHSLAEIVSAREGKAIAKRLTDDDLALRFWEGWMHRRWPRGKKLATKPLLAALRSPSQHHRWSAAHALWWCEDAEATDALIEVLESDVVAEVRAQAVEALKHHNRDMRAVEPLIRALDDPSPEVRFWAACALGMLGDSSAIPALERLKSDDAVCPGWWSVGKEAEGAIEQIGKAAEATAEPPGQDR